MSIIIIIILKDENRVNILANLKKNKKWGEWFSFNHLLIICSISLIFISNSKIFLSFYSNFSLSIFTSSVGATFNFFNLTNFVEFILIVDLTDSLDESLFVDYSYSYSDLNFIKQSFIFSIRTFWFVFYAESQLPPVPEASSWKWDSARGALSFLIRLPVSWSSISIDFSLISGELPTISNSLWPSSSYSYSLSVGCSIVFYASSRLLFIWSWVRLDCALLLLPLEIERTKLDLILKDLYEFY
jgi:hypothetical protein